MIELTTRHRLEIAGLVALSCLVAAIAIASGQFTLVSGPRQILLYAYDNSGSRSEVPRDVSASIGDGWQQTKKGLRLMPGHAGDITIRLADNYKGRLLLFLESAATAPVPLTISTSSDSFAYTETVRSLVDGRGRFDLTASVGSSAPVWLRIRMTNDSSRSAQEDPAVSRIRLIRLTSSSGIPNLPLACLLILVPMLAYLTRTATHRTGSFPFGLAVLAGLAALAATLPPQHQDSPQWWISAAASRDGHFALLVPYLLLMTILGWHVRIWMPSAPLHQLWTRFALAGTMVWAANLRLVELMQFGLAAPNADTIEYLNLAATMASPYDTSVREPLWIWMIRGWSWLAGYDTLPVRIFTVMISVGLLVVAYRFFRDYTGHPLPGILVAALLGTNPYLVTLSTRGLRDEAFVAAVLCTTYFVFVRGTTLSLRGQAVGLALSGAAAQLLRFNSYLFLVPLLLVWSWKQRSAKPHYALLPLVFIAAMSAPHLIHNFRAYGDPMYSINVHAPWARNQEFLVIKRTGCEGCPSPAELTHDLYAGAPVTATEYLLGMHSVQELASITGRGYLNFYLTPTDLFATQTGTRSAGGYALYLVGLALMLCGPHRELLALIVLLANVTPFVVMMGAEPRIMIHSAPYTTFVMIYALYWLLTRFASGDSRGSLTTMKGET